jgi:hypothetical protein
MKLENLEFVKASPDNSMDPTKGLLASNMPLLLNTAWSLSAMDIESSVSAAAFIHCSIHSLRLFPLVCVSSLCVPFTCRLSHPASGKSSREIRHARRGRAVADAVQPCQGIALAGKGLSVASHL